MGEQDEGIEAFREIESLLEEIEALRLTEALLPERFLDIEIIQKGETEIAVLRLGDAGTRFQLERFNAAWAVSVLGRWLGGQGVHLPLYYMEMIREAATAGAGTPCLSNNAVMVKARRDGARSEPAEMLADAAAQLEHAAVTVHNALHAIRVADLSFDASESGTDAGLAELRVNTREALRSAARAAATCSNMFMDQAEVIWDALDAGPDEETAQNA